MVKATFDVLAESDKQLVLETEPKKLDKLDEDGLIALHTRVRRARNKHAKLYRREAGAQVAADKTRAQASKKNRRNAARAEVFEDALARVSRRLAAVARASAAELRTQRIALARGEAKSATKAKSSAKAKTAAKAKPAGSAKGKAKRRTPASEKARATTKAAGKRGQAKRDRR